MLVHRNQEYLRIKFETKLENLSRKRKEALAPKSSSSMSINLSAYILHVMTMPPIVAWQDILGESVKPILNAIPTSTFYILTRRQPLLIIVKQATALAILSALKSILQTIDVAVAICQEEQAVLEKRWPSKNDFCKQMVLQKN